MRKYITLTLLLACISVGGILWTHVHINAQQDDITVKETTEAGRLDLTAGIKVTNKVQDSMYRLNWTTDMFLDGTKEIKSETVFDYDRAQKIELNRDIEETFYLLEEFGYVGHSIAEDDLKGDTSGLLGAMPKELVLAASKKAGKQRSSTINLHLDDYTDYLPITLESNSYYYDPKTPITYYDIDGNLNDWTGYFQIPVPKDFDYQVTVKKDASFRLTAVTLCTANDTNLYTVNSDGFWDNENLYLAVSGITEGADNKILSNCPPSKKGIHLIPTAQKLEMYLDLTKAKMVYPIDIDAQVVDMRQGDDGETIFLLTRDSDGLVLDIIDKNSMTCSQKLRLHKASGYGEECFLSLLGDGWVFYLFDQGDFLFIAEKEGKYEETIAGTIGHFFEEPFIACDYDGDRLAIVTTDWESSVIETQLRLFDKTGCLYRGRFDYTMGQYYYDDDDGGYGYDKRVYVEFED